MKAVVKNRLTPTLPYLRIEILHFDIVQSCTNLNEELA